ncbi:hypothetical protein AUP68_06430 [Ilyonectria robusta]
MGINHSRFVANHVLQVCERSRGQEYIASKDLETTEEEHNELVDKWVETPASFLDCIPSGDNLACRLFRGSCDGDQVTKRLCATFFFQLRADFNKRFHAKGHGDALASHLVKFGVKLPANFTKARQLTDLYKKAPALLLLSVNNNIHDFESILPNDEYRIKDAVTKLASSMPESIKIYDKINLVFEYLQASWKKWMLELEAEGKRKEQTDIGTDKARKKKSDRVSIQSIPLATSNQRTEPEIRNQEQGKRLFSPSVSLDGQDLTKTQALDSTLMMLTVVQSSTTTTFAPSITDQSVFPSASFSSIQGLFFLSYSGG